MISPVPDGIRMNELTGEVEKCFRQIDDILTSLDDRRLPGAEAFAAKMYVPSVLL